MGPVAGVRRGAGAAASPAYRSGNALSTGSTGRALSSAATLCSGRIPGASLGVARYPDRCEPGSL